MAESAARPPVAVRVTRPYANEDDFLANELETLGKTSVILVGAAPQAAGAVLRFEVVLQSGAVLLRGEGRVLAHKENAFRGQAGLGLRFTRLDPRSKALVDRAVALRDAKGGSRGKPVSARPPAPSVDVIPTSVDVIPTSVDVAPAPSTDVMPAPSVDVIPTPVDVAPAPAEAPRSSEEVAAPSPEHAAGPVLDVAAAPASAPAIEEAAPSVDIDIPISVELPVDALPPPPPASPGLAATRPEGRDALLERLRQRASGLDPARVAAILGKR